MALVTKAAAKKHFNAGGTVEFISYEKGARKAFNKAQIAKMFSVTPADVKFENVIKYGCDGMVNLCFKIV
jgi:hypothetical protein